MADGTRSEAGARPRIAVLPEVVRNQIAAGEVVERPASVVKELVENALDAGATRIAIDLEEGGARLVRVVDDGGGMGPEDLALAFVPHATSKLGALEDLEHVASLGFRGEALASMGAVARCRILSRRPGEEQGHEVRDEGGRLSAVARAGAPVGTAVEVRDLFFNTPARRRFLKRASSELARCLDVVQRLALASPGTAFVLAHDGKRVLDVERSMDLRARVRRAFGAELAEALVEVRAAEGGLALEGLVAPPRFARADATRQMWFLNGRPLKDKLLARCLREAWRGALFEGRQPVAFLSLSVPPELVDVNVHPAKAEVRFREDRRVFGFCLSALRPAVRRTDMATPGELLLARVARREGPGGQGFPRQAGFLDLPPRPVPGELLEVREVEPRAAAGATERARWDTAPRRSTPFLVVARTYVVREVEGGFEVVDQHALHERVTYEALLAEARRGAVERQRLLVPELLELPPEDVALVEEHAEALPRAGIELAPFGRDALALSALPARLARGDAAELVRALVRVLRRTGLPPEPARLLEDVLHSAACRGSVMAGDALDEEELRALFERAAGLEHDQTCPHGRPTRVRFTLADLEKAFARR
jgi:DNA mismatch repair protein MutL